MPGMLRAVADTQSLDTRLALISDPQYWLRLNPRMTIGSEDPSPWEPESPVAVSGLDQAISSYQTEGFLSLPHVLSSRHAERMRTAIQRLHDAGWPPVFCFLYDGLWLVARAGVLPSLLHQLLGGEPRLMPRIWAHYVPASRGNSGWLPHVDAGDDGRRAVSLWVPLSSATVTNGCMYIVKRDERIPETMGQSRDRADFSPAEVMTILRAVRALPAEPGTILCWDETTLHWGATYESGSEPRISFALEFTAASNPMEPGESWWDPTQPLPSFAERLRLAASAMLHYARFEPRVEPLIPLAEMILARV